MLTVLLVLIVLIVPIVLIVLMVLMVILFLILLIHSFRKNSLVRSQGRDPESGTTSGSAGAFFAIATPSTLSGAPKP